MCLLLTSILPAPTAYLKSPYDLMVAPFLPPSPHESSNIDSTANSFNSSPSLASPDIHSVLTPPASSDIPLVLVTITEAQISNLESSSIQHNKLDALIFNHQLNNSCL